ncbi:MAG: type III pantothenate kinase [bacterium]|nr:type III pantothenate kinase [bacterium]
MTTRQSCRTGTVSPNRAPLVPTVPEQCRGGGSCRAHRRPYRVDVGTATTVDVLSARRFRGRVIAPGMAFALQQIGARAARLRHVPFAEVPLVAGADTSSAMAAGAFHAGIGGVENLVTACRPPTGHRRSLSPGALPVPGCADASC